VKNIETLVKGSPLAIFDFDGTLYHIEVDWDGAYEALSMIGREFDHIGDFRSLRSAYEWAAGKYRIKERLVALQNEYEESGIPDRVKIQQGMAAAMWRRERGLPNAVLSLNTSYTLDRVLGHKGFYPMISIDKVDRPKPDPEGLEIILRAHERLPEEAVFIGNSDIDSETAARGGVDFIHVADIKEEWFG
jgi:HAD superfamily hydrolase (TIGR01549 family)